MAQINNLMMSKKGYTYNNIIDKIEKFGKNFLNLTQTHYPKDFAEDYSQTPTRSIFKRITKDAKINISNLTMCRFFNQYLKKQKIFLRKKEKRNKEILTALQNVYPDAFPKNNKKLLKKTSSQEGGHF